MATTPKQVASSDSDDSVRPETFELACIAARAADDKQATNTIVLSVGNVLTITELFVVTGASNPRLVRAVAIEIEDRIREVCGRSPGRTEGHREQSWVLLDYGDVIVHIFLDETREFYEIERLYKDVPRLEWRA